MTESSSEERSPSPRPRPGFRARTILAWCAAGLVFYVISYGGLAAGVLAGGHGAAIALVSASFLFLSLALLLQPLRAGPAARELRLWPLIGVALLPAALAAAALLLRQFSLLVDAAGVAFFTGFAWLFLRWLLAEAGAGGAAPVGWIQLLPRRGGQLIVPRGALALFFAIALIIFGLGAAVHRGDARCPPPLLPLVGFSLLALIFLALARLHRLQAQASQSNLAISPRLRPNWGLAALLSILALAALAAALPKWQWPPDSGSAPRLGRSRVPDVQVPPQARFQLPSASETGGKPFPSEGSSSAAPREAGAAAPARRMPVIAPQQGGEGDQGLAGLAAGSRASLWWLLLLALVVLGLLVFWLSRRFRVGRLLRRAVALLAARIRRVATALAAWVRKRLAPRPASAEPGAGRRLAVTGFAAPRDIFDDEGRLARLSAGEIVIIAFHQLLALAERFGRGRRVCQTPFEFAYALAPGDEGLRHFAWSYARASYSLEPLSPAELPAIRATWQRLRAGLLPSGGSSPGAASSASETRDEL